MREPPDDKPSEWRELEEIFADLLESEDPDSRLASIEDPVLRAAATRIWNHHMNAASAGFLQEPAVLGMVGAFQPGQRLSARFVIERLLGTGGMGQVYLAKDDLLGVHVAVKTIAPMLAPLPYMRRRFVAEVQNARRVTHRALRPNEWR